MADLNQFPAKGAPPSLDTVRRRLERERKIRKQLEKMLEDKTRELFVALESLQDQKLALNRLSAGVAHEINNALNFVRGNTQHLERYVGVFEDVIEAYRQAVADREDVAKELAEFESSQGLDFIRKDLPKLLAAIHTGVARASDIVHDLGAFSRPSGEDMELTSVERPIDMALTLSTNTLKRKVTVHKEYDCAEPVRCHVGQLCQVFLNLFINAADAIDTKGDIFIKTRLVDDQVEIEVRDTGAGMKEILSAPVMNCVRKVFMIWVMR